ncbi:hypothetical protein CVT25_001526 [Psilocybe cyanescens]|uniref:Uncharacterized protein n=1 Tax=Psilocybe cyanescens TaxID=93625 RepID=A0A409X5M6_PSICY|nr:hypothetical protein CVT25_001526 [Psilocybe cyanescens]
MAELCRESTPVIAGEETQYGGVSTPKITPPRARWSQPISTQAGKPLLSSPLAPSSFSLYHIYPTGPSTSSSSPFVPSLMHTSNQNRAYTHANPPYPTSSITISPLPSRKHMPSRPALAPSRSGSPAPKKRTASRASAQGPAGVATVVVASTGAATGTNALGSHDPVTTSGSVSSAASVQQGATGSATNADVLTTTPTASVPTGGAGAGNGSGSGAGGAIPTGAKTGGAVKSTAGVREPRSQSALSSSFSISWLSFEGRWLAITPGFRHFGLYANDDTPDGVKSRMDQAIVCPKRKLYFELGDTIRNVVSE